jgi:hypothetical protein
MGNTITVNGTNNICLGNNFTTSGTNSIIVGNDIGAASGTDTGSTTSGNNDIYESIIIGNKSFQDSIVRNVICIGRKNMIGLNQLSLTDTTRVQTFLGKYPVLIGNNIGSDMIDFNVNIDNTFLKTTINKQSTVAQIYLGLSNEVVAVGHNKNNSLTPDYSLNVAGAICATHVNATTTMTATAVDSKLIDLGYIVSASGNFTNNLTPIIYKSLSTSSTIQDVAVIGISCGVTNETYVLVGLKGSLRVWCDTAVASGQLLQASSTSAGVASGCPTTLRTIMNYTFAKSITTWDGKQSSVSANPYVTTRSTNGITYGLIWCMMV